MWSKWVTSYLDTTIGLRCAVEVVSQLASASLPLIRPAAAGRHRHDQLIRCQRNRWAPSSVDTAQQAAAHQAGKSRCSACGPRTAAPALHTAHERQAYSYIVPVPHAHVRARCVRFAAGCHRYAFAAASVGIHDGSCCLGEDMHDECSTNRRRKCPGCPGSCLIGRLGVSACSPLKRVHGSRGVCRYVKCLANKHVPSKRHSNELVLDARYLGTYVLRDAC